MPARHRRHREVEADDRVYREHQRCRKAPPAGATPSHTGSSGASNRASPATAFRTCTSQRAWSRGRAACRVGNHADVPEHHRDGRVGGHREHVPRQRGAELRPHIHGAGIGEQPVPQPRPPQVQDREHARAHHREDGHRLGEAVDGVAPGLLEQQQNRGDQRARVADTNPPHEVDDGEAPGIGNGDAPDADALQEQPGHRNQQQARYAACDGQAADPTHRRVSVSTRPAIFWVTDLKLCPGAITAYSPVRGSIAGSRTAINGRFGRHAMQAPGWG